MSVYYFVGQQRCVFISLPSVVNTIIKVIIDGERYRQNISPLELDGSHRTAGIITILIGGRTINYAVQQWKPDDVLQWCYGVHEQCKY